MQRTSGNRDFKPIRRRLQYHENSFLKRNVNISVYKLSTQNKNVRLYEFGNIYIPKALPLTELPDERMQMTLGMYGECDFFTLKGVVEDMLDSLGLGGRSEYAPTGEHPFLHPGRAADVTIDGEKIAYIGQIHPEVMDNYNMKGEVYVAVIDMPTLVPKATFDRKYEGVAKFPAMKRDLVWL